MNNSCVPLCTSCAKWHIKIVYIILGFFLEQSSHPTKLPNLLLCAYWPAQAFHHFTMHVDRGSSSAFCRFTLASLRILRHYVSLYFTSTFSIPIFNTNPFFPLSNFLSIFKQYLSWVFQSILYAFKIYILFLTQVVTPLPLQ